MEVSGSLGYCHMGKSKAVCVRQPLCGVKWGVGEEGDVFLHLTALSSVT